MSSERLPMRSQHLTPERVGLLVTAVLGFSVARPARGQDVTTQPETEEVTGYQEGNSDLEQRLIVRLDLETNTVFSARSGDPDALEIAVPDDSGRNDSSFVFGDLRLGTRGLGYRPLNTYFMGTGGVNLGGAPQTQALEELRANDAALHQQYIDAYGDNAFFLRLAYGELAGITESGPLSGLLVRAGRQFHWSGLMGVTFDGLTMQYSTGQVEVSGRIGQRAGVFERFQTDRGFTGGASVKVDLSSGRGGFPLLLKGEYMFVTRDLRLTPRGQAALGGVEESVTIHLGEIGAYWDLDPNTLLSLRVQSTDSEISHVRADLRWLSDIGALSIFVDQKIGEELLYAMSGARTQTIRDLRTGIDRRAVLEAFRLNIPDRQPFTRIDADFAFAVSDWLEVQPKAGANIVYGDAEELSPWDATHFSWGLAAFARTKLNQETGIEVDVDYTGRVYDRDETVGAFGLFSDVAAGPEQSSHEVYAGVRFNLGNRFIGNRMLQGRRLSLGLGGFVRLYQLETVHEDQIDDEVLTGIEAKAAWQIARQLGLNARYQFAQDSNVLLPQLAAFHEVFGEAQVLF